MDDQTPLATIEGLEGVVKWFDPRKGFGFIVGPEGQDIFVHFSVIQGGGFRVLKDGSSVVYDAAKSEKGWKATRVMRQAVIEVPLAQGMSGMSGTSGTSGMSPGSSQSLGQGLAQGLAQGMAQGLAQGAVRSGYTRSPRR